MRKNSKRNRELKHWNTIEYFKELSAETGIPYQVLINLYLDECVKEKKKIQFV